MTVSTSIRCLDDAMLAKLARGDCSPNELLACEDHLSSCDHCRQLVDSRALDAVWTEELLPAFQVTRNDDDRTVRAEAFHQAVIRILGPTDDPHMLGRIGSYEVVALVGIGGMGAVFKAFDAALNRFVAIKIMLPHLAASGAARQRFEREGRAAAAVVSDFVLPIYAVAEWQGVPYLVMQYSAGINLQKRLENSGPLMLDQALRIAMQTARGLAAAHAQGLVHRDVKPSNILLDGSVERATLTDFGLARAVDDASVTRTGLIAGTPQYMSPEQVRGEAVDERSDLFSLGSTMYSMCTGHPPFRSDSSYAVLHRIVSDHPRSIREVNREIPEWFEHIVMKLLSKSASDRFDSAERVADLLEACLAHVQQPSSVSLPKSLLQTDSKSERFSRLFKFVASAAFFLLTLAGVVIVLELDKGTLTIECEADDVPIRIMQGDTVVKKLMVSREGKSTKIAAGNYTIEIEKPFDKALVADGTVTIKLAGKQVVKVKSSVDEEPEIQRQGIRTITHNLENLLRDKSRLRAEQKMAELVKLICSTVDPESWSNAQINIIPYLDNRCFVVSQTQKNHDAIAKLLNELEALELRANNPQSTKESKNAVEVTSDAETGVTQIRGQSKELVERAAIIIQEMNERITQESIKSSEATNFLKFFEAIHASQNQEGTQQIPVKLLQDCVPSSIRSNPSKSTFQFTAVANIKKSESPDGMPDGMTVYEFQADILKLMQEFLFVTLGDDDLSDQIVDGMLNDPKGPKVDIKRILREQLSNHVKLTVGTLPNGQLNFLVEIKVNDMDAFLPNFIRFFQSEDGYLSNEAKNFFYFGSQSSPAAIGQRRTQAAVAGVGMSTARRVAATVHQGRFYCGSLDMVEAVRREQ